MRAHAQPVAPVATILDVAAPIQMVQIPADGLAQSGLEGFDGRPAQLAPDPAGVDGVADIVARPIGDVGDQLGIGAPALGGELPSAS